MPNRIQNYTFTPPNKGRRRSRFLATNTVMNLHLTNEQLYCEVAESTPRHAPKRQVVGLTHQTSREDIQSLLQHTDPEAKVDLAIWAGRLPNLELCKALYPR